MELRALRGELLEAAEDEAVEEDVFDPDPADFPADAPTPPSTPLLPTLPSLTASKCI